MMTAVAIVAGLAVGWILRMIFEDVRSPRTVVKSASLKSPDIPHGYDLRVTLTSGEHDVWLFEVEPKERA